jgi:hypothetical protein
MNKTLIIGLGTGRCGTYSLTELLNSQLNSDVRHEHNSLPWEPEIHLLYQNIFSLLSFDAEIVGDVGFSYINYIDRIVKTFQNTKCICLQRNKWEVVDSFDKRTPEENYWTDPTSKFYNWKKYKLDYRTILFPSYDLPKRDAIAAYWDEYTRKASYWQKAYPDNFLLLGMDYSLNTHRGVEQVLSFIGISEDDMVVNVGIESNKSNVQTIKVDKVDPVAFLRADYDVSCKFCEKASSLFITNITCGTYIHTCDAHEVKGVEFLNTKQKESL